MHNAAAKLTIKHRCSALLRGVSADGRMNVNTHRYGTDTRTGYEPTQRAVGVRCRYVRESDTAATGSVVVVWCLRDVCFVLSFVFSFLRTWERRVARDGAVQTLPADMVRLVVCVCWRGRSYARVSVSTYGEEGSWWPRVSFWAKADEDALTRIDRRRQVNHH